MLVADGIRLAYREGNVLGLGETPSDAENAEALLTLNAFRRTVLGYELGENFQDWLIPAPATSPCPSEGLVYLQQTPWYLGPYQNRRLLLTVTADTTIYFPNDPDPGARMACVNIGSSAVNITISGNGRLIEGVASITRTPAELSGQKWFYRADLASWELIEDIELADTAFPFEDDFDDLWIAYLAIRLGPRNDAEATATTQAVYVAALKRAKARYRQTERVGVTFATTGVSVQSFPQMGNYFPGDPP